MRLSSVYKIYIYVRMSVSHKRIPAALFTNEDEIGVVHNVSLFLSLPTRDIRDGRRTRPPRRTSRDGATVRDSAT